MRVRLCFCVVVFAALSAFAQTLPDRWKTHKGLGQQALQEGRYPVAEEEFRKALALSEPDPPSEQHRIISLCDLAEVSRLTGRLEPASQFLQRALPLAEKLSSSNPGPLAILLNNLATVYLAQGKLKEAESVSMRSLTVQERAFGPDSKYAHGTRTNLASIYERQGRHEEAEKLLLENLAAGEKQFGAESREVAFVLNNLATMKTNHGQEQEAETLLQRALPLFRARWGPEHPYTVMILNNLGAVYLAIGQPEKGEGVFTEALAIEERTPEGVGLAITLNGLAILNMQWHRYVAADPMLHRSLSLRERYQGPTHPEVASTLIDLGRLNLETEHLAEAASLLKQAQAIAEKIEPPDNRLLHKLYVQLGALQSKRGDLKGSRRLFEKALGSARDTFGSQSTAVARSLSYLGSVSRDLHHYLEAEQLYQQAIQLLDNAHLSKEVAEIRGEYAKLLRQTHRDSEAERLERP